LSIHFSDLKCQSFARARPGVMSTILCKPSSTELCQLFYVNHFTTVEWYFIKPKDLHNTALCQLYYVNEGCAASVYTGVAAAKAAAAAIIKNQLRSCVATQELHKFDKKMSNFQLRRAVFSKLHKKYRSWNQKFCYFDERKTLDKTENL